MVKVSVIVTVFNEAGSIRQLLSALYTQSRKPNEIVIVDANSTDSTWTILQNQAKLHPNLKIYQKPGIRSIGRNFAIQKATGNIIGITDAGCIPEKNWLAELIKPFWDPKVVIVSGYYTGLPKTIFEKCVVPYVLVMPDKIPSEFLPSTRSMALRKSIWTKYGGFDEQLDPSEDFEYATRLHRQGIRFFFAPKAVVGWRPRATLKQTAWMFLRFAAGDILAGIYRPKVKLLAIRYLIFIYLFFLAVQIPIVWPIVIVMSVVYLGWAIKKNYHYVSNIRAIYWLPILQITADVMVMFGTTIGLFYKMSIPQKPA